MLGVAGILGAEIARPDMFFYEAGRPENLPEPFTNINMGGLLAWQFCLMHFVEVRRWMDYKNFGSVNEVSSSGWCRHQLWRVHACSVQGRGGSSSGRWRCMLRCRCQQLQQQLWAACMLSSTVYRRWPAAAGSSGGRRGSNACWQLAVPGAAWMRQPGSRPECQAGSAGARPAVQGMWATLCYRSCRCGASMRRCCAALAISRLLLPATNLVPAWCPCCRPAHLHPTA